MKTEALVPAEVWVVDVEDERELDKNMPGYSRRFYFDDAVEAWTCWANATRMGFRAKSEKVKR